MTTNTTDYNKQGIWAIMWGATDFLQATGTTLEIVETVPQIPAQWDSKNNDKHISYSVTLKNKNHTYTFNFWGSEHDYNLVEKAKEAKERGTHSAHYAECERELEKKYGMLQLKQLVDDMHKHVSPSEYDILACLSPMYEDTFEDFCNAYGYDTDSRTAEETYKRCIEQDRQLHKLFTHEQLEQLAEIN